jgi:hypothetical protein
VVDELILPDSAMLKRIAVMAHEAASA